MRLAGQGKRTCHGLVLSPSDELASRCGDRRPGACTVWEAGLVVSCVPVTPGSPGPGHAHRGDALPRSARLPGSWSWPRQVRGSCMGPAKSSWGPLAGPVRGAEPTPEPGPRRGCPNRVPSDPKCVGSSFCPTPRSLPSVLGVRPFSSVSAPMGYGLCPPHLSPRRTPSQIRATHRLTDRLWSQGVPLLGFGTCRNGSQNSVCDAGRSSGTAEAEVRRPSVGRDVGFHLSLPALPPPPPAPRPKLPAPLVAGHGWRFHGVGRVDDITGP